MRHPRLILKPCIQNVHQTCAWIFTLLFRLPASRTSLISTLKGVHDYKGIINQAVIRIEVSYESIVDALKNLARSQLRSAFTSEGRMNTVEAIGRHGLIAMVLLATATLSGCMGWVPGRQAYWDAQVKEMCAKDGGVQIFEKLRISKSDIDLLGRVGGKIGVPVKELAHPNSPAYSVLTITNLREWNPRVSRSESTIIRRADQAVVARSVVYARSGGDFPTGFSEGTSFVCPDLKKITSDLQQLFVVEGDSK